MGKLTKANHVFNVLIAVVATAVIIPFHSGIPWFAWIGAFMLFLLSAEFFSTLIQPKDQENQKRSNLTAFFIALVAAVALGLLAVAYLMW